MPKKKLSKGFDDLFSQNETELSFLDAYGKVNSESVKGLPESSANIQNSDELFDVIVRYLKSEQIGFKLSKTKISIDIRSIHKLGIIVNPPFYKYGTVNNSI